MPSAITANISSAASKALPNQQAPVAQQAQTQPDTNQVIRSTQVNAQSTARKVVDDKKRSAQVPKRAEGTFTPQQAKKKPGLRSSEEDKETPNSSNDKVDVVA